MTPRASFASDADLFNTYALADAKSKTISELLWGISLPMSIDEYVHWLAFFRYREKLAERRAEQERQKRKVMRETQGE